MRTHTRQHGYPIVASMPCGKGRVIVADRGTEAPHRYAVWREDEDGYTHGGQYVDDLKQANSFMVFRAQG